MMLTSMILQGVCQLKLKNSTDLLFQMHVQHCHSLDSTSTNWSSGWGAKVIVTNMINTYINYQTTEHN